MYRNRLNVNQGSVAVDEFSQALDAVVIFI